MRTRSPYATDRERVHTAAAAAGTTVGELDVIHPQIDMRLTQWDASAEAPPSPNTRREKSLALHRVNQATEHELRVDAIMETGLTELDRAHQRRGRRLLAAIAEYQVGVDERLADEAGQVGW